MFNYGRIIGTIGLSLLGAASLMFQFLVVGLGISDPAAGLGMGIACANVTLALVFLLGLLGGLRWALRTAGWTMAVQLAFYALMLFAISGSARPAFVEDTFVGRNAIALGIGLLCLGAALAAILIRTRTPSAKPSA